MTARALIVGDDPDNLAMLESELRRGR